MLLVSQFHFVYWYCASGADEKRIFYRFDIECTVHVFHNRPNFKRETGETEFTECTFGRQTIFYTRQYLLPA